MTLPTIEELVNEITIYTSGSYANPIECLFRLVKPLYDSREEYEKTNQGQLDCIVRYGKLEGELRDEIKQLKIANDKEKGSMDSIQLIRSRLYSNKIDTSVGLIKTNIKLRDEVEQLKSKPVCPQCNAEMEKCWAGKCDDGTSFPVWVCNCVE